MAELSKVRIISMSVCIAAAYIVWGLLISLQPPFYPSEAEKKGATPSQYGFVFGIANLAAFIFAPFFGRYGAKIGPKILYNCGAYLQAICGICFGFLTYVEGANLFIGLSYLLRALGGIADVAAWGAVLSILMKMFPSQVARIMSLTEMFFGLGYMLGPALGALLYSAGGFQLPFLVVGCIGLVIATGLLILIPNVKTEPKKATAKLLNYVEVVKYPSIFMPFVDNLCCFFCNGMITSMLEPHLASVGATTNDVGITFLVLGATFMISTPLAGTICDKISYPSMVSVWGNAMMVIAFSILGPLPSFALQPSYGLITGAVALTAFGYANVMVSTFSRAQGAALRCGFEQDIDTYLLISGMWSASFYLGNFLGPTIAGFMVEAYGFRSSTVLFFSFLCVLLAFDICELGYNLKNKLSSKNIHYEQLM